MCVCGNIIDTPPLSVCIPIYASHTRSMARIVSGKSSRTYVLVTYCIVVVRCSIVYWTVLDCAYVYEITIMVFGF